MGQTFFLYLIFCLRLCQKKGTISFCVAFLTCSFIFSCFTVSLDTRFCCATTMFASIKNLVDINNTFSKNGLLSEKIKALSAKLRHKKQEKNIFLYKKKTKTFCLSQFKWAYKKKRKPWTSKGTTMVGERTLGFWGVNNGVPSQHKM